MMTIARLVCAAAALVPAATCLAQGPYLAYPPRMNAPSVGMNAEPPRFYVPHGLPSQGLRQPLSVQALTSPHAAQYAPRAAVAPPSQGVANANVAVPTNKAEWEPLARTNENRVIDFAQFGDGPRHVLIVGPLDGSAVEGVQLVDQLVAFLARFPRRLTDATVTIVRDPNPDGRQRRAIANARGVELDRNFGTKTWRKNFGAANTAGGAPESEPETRALADLLEDLRPDRVIVLGATSGTPTVTFAGPADGLARRMSLDANLRIVKLDAAAAPGGLLELAGVEHGMPAVRLDVPARTTPDANWNNYKRAILTAIELGGNPRPASVADQPPPRGAPPSAATSAPPLPVTGQASLYAPVRPSTPAPVNSASPPYHGGLAEAHPSAATQPEWQPARLMGQMVPLSPPAQPTNGMAALPHAGVESDQSNARFFTGRIFMPQPPIPLPR